ncbi:MAG: endonuclease, partial [Planctomycetes bacterium]|nr:endonuclease [Planctomycetota bacterium]
MKKCVFLTVFVFSQFTTAEPITMMSFNIRYGTANDGKNSWEYRKDHVIETIRNEKPAALAIQEALLGQLQ